MNKKRIKRNEKKNYNKNAKCKMKNKKKLSQTTVPNRSDEQGAKRIKKIEKEKKTRTILPRFDTSYKQRPVALKLGLYYTFSYARRA